MVPKSVYEIIQTWQAEYEKKKMALISQLPHGVGVAQGISGLSAGSGHNHGSIGIAGGSGGGGGGGGIANHQIPWAPVASIHQAPYWMLGESELMGMLCMRMRWGIYDPAIRMGPVMTAPAKFARLMVCQVDDKVIVLACNSGQDPVVFTDDANMFPSDNLVSQLRLLEN